MTRRAPRSLADHGAKSLTPAWAARVADADDAQLDRWLDALIPQSMFSARKAAMVQTILDEQGRRLSVARPRAATTTAEPTPPASVQAEPCEICDAPIADPTGGAFCRDCRADLDDHWRQHAAEFAATATTTTA